jgi:hypothetical protein
MFRLAKRGRVMVMPHLVLAAVFCYKRSCINTMLRPFPEGDPPDSPQR